MTEKEYRALEIDSYSSLSCFLKDRKAYAREYIYKDKVDKEEKSFLTIGSIVDCLTLTPEEFDDRFLIVKEVKGPTGQMMDYTNCLLNKSITHINGWEEIIPLDDEIMLSCYEQVGFKRDTFDKVKYRFEKEGREYYDFLIKKRQEGIGNKTVITNNDYELAVRISEGLKKSPITGILINRTSDDRTTVINQLPVVFEYNDYQLKSLMDKVVIDHDKKIIHLYDLKTAYNPEEFENNYYRFNYYIQASLYWIALRKWAQKKGYIDRGYTVNHMKFIVCDNTNYYSPLIYKTTEEHYVQAISGFYREGKYHKGLNQIINELKWHKRNNIWNISHDNFKEEGEVTITLGEDDRTDKGYCYSE